MAVINLRWSYKRGGRKAGFHCIFFLMEYIIFYPHNIHWYNQNTFSHYIMTSFNLIPLMFLLQFQSLPSFP